MVTWSDCHDAFRSDGGLRDIYILDADVSVWESALTFLRSAGDVLFTLDGQPATVPTTARQALELQGTAAPVLTIRWEGVDFACHFFGEQEVELDFVPSEIDGPGKFDSLVSFLRGLAVATGREVRVTPENQSDRPFLKYDPSAEQLAYIGGAG